MKTIRNIRDSLLYGLKWKGIFKDLIKFYLYLVLFYSLAFLLVWGQMYLSLQNLTISIDQISLDPFDPRPPVKEFNFKDHEIIAKKMSQYMFTLVFFGVFFTVPPKKARHVIITALLICLTANIILVDENFRKWLSDNIYILINALYAWLCSVAWFRLKEKMQK